MITGSVLLLKGSILYGTIILITGAAILVGTIFYYHNRKKGNSCSDNVICADCNFIPKYDCDCDCNRNGGDCDCSPDCN